MTAKSKIIISISAVLGTLIVAVLVFMIHKNNEQIKEMTQQYEIEKEQLADEYSQLAIQYEGYQLNVNNDSLLDKLENERLKVQRLVEELKTTKATNSKRINELKKELGVVRTVLRSYIEQVDSLNQENARLQKKNEEVTRKYQEISRNATELKTQKEVLEKQVTLASKLDAVGIITEGLTKRNKSTDKISRAEMLKISFTLSKNITAEVGEKDIFIRIVRPDEEVLIKDRNNLFRFEDSEINYSVKKIIEYTGEEQPVVMYWNIEEFLSPGIYRIDIFADGNIIGKKDFKLDK